MTIKFDDREAWLTEAALIILEDIVLPKGGSMPPYRVSVGWPKGSRGGKAIAQCFARAASADGVNEIFTSPEISEPDAVLEALVHELIHAVLDCQGGHRGAFARIARAVGLEGPLTATHAGPKLTQQLAEIIEILGDFPHAKLDVDLVRKKDGTRQLKVTCNDRECGAIWRASAKWAHQMHRCPVCTSPGVTVHG